ncbi:TetR/AcrR family transcriptional regulator [Paenibacillus sp. 19GGS1-52]|uniref:TetR/AcrR family transcriptional regulator n=1 Tax=Paenibacillus sp. 19GGS1-52 TaxID=2758563 RepID=UPI001EFC1686|nr:TetR/AcrR family transcriptional regulator [Paenibacillus sp. 19GGS1-52]ULO05300.1 TetR/AcrR family transcriptional regulator [Paenibacillus sp. 19GGS1-52]
MMTKINGDANSPPKQANSSQEAAKDPYVERILDAARQLFLENGLEAVSMHRIAKKAGIGQASLYRRFTDIGEICSVLLRDNSERFLNGMEQEIQLTSEDLPAFERLQSSIERVVDFLEQHAELLNLIKTEFTGKKQLTQFEHPFFQRLNVILFQLLQQVAARAESIPIDPQFVATALVSVLSPDLYLFQKKVHGRSKEQITKGIITLFVTGLRNP